MMKILFTILLLGLFVSPAVANADTEISVSDVEKMCAQPDEVNQNACTLYIGGVLQGMAMVEGESYLKSPTYYCLPLTANWSSLISQAKRLVHKLAAHDETKDAPASFGIALAFKQTTPCPPIRLPQQ
jgi:Rap1a immunity proteins